MRSSARRGTVLLALNLFLPQLLFADIELPTLAKRLGFEALPLAAVHGESEFSLTIAPVSRCTFGDRDALFLELAQSKNRRLLLTVELLTGAVDETPLAKLNLTDAQVTRVEHRLRIRGGGERLAGIFLCRDGEGSGRCIDKPVVELDRVLQQYAPGIKNSQQPVDKSYFFQPLLLSGDTLWIPTRPFLPSGLALFVEEVQRRAPPERAAAGRYVERLMQLLISEPLQREGQRVVAVLPGYDRARCEGR